jgi:hypothetical protein
MKPFSASSFNAAHTDNLSKKIIAFCFIVDHQDFQCAEMYDLFNVPTDVVLNALSFPDIQILYESDCGMTSSFATSQSDYVKIIDCFPKLDILVVI